MNLFSIIDNKNLLEFSVWVKNYYWKIYFFLFINSIQWNCLEPTAEAELQHQRYALIFFKEVTLILKSKL